MVRCMEGQTRWGVLPTELLLEILYSASALSQATYRSLLLVSRQMYQLSQLGCLSLVPITLEDYYQLHSFEYFLRTVPQVQSQVRHLWIMGDGLTCWLLIQPILRMCTSIISLSCTSRSLLCLCTHPTFDHTQCTSLTLIENWHAWKDIIKTPHGTRLCSQLTHLRMHEGLTPEFPKQHFPRLRYLAFSSRPVKEYFERHLATLESLPELQHLVISTFWWRDEAPDIRTSMLLLDLDKRLYILYCRKAWTELAAWQAGVRGGLSLWEQARVDRRSMQIYRGIFKLVSYPAVMVLRL